MYVAFFAGVGHALERGTVKENTVVPLPIEVDGRVLDTHVALDANWRWIHYTDGYENCFTDEWVCGSAEECTRNCALEGVTEEEWVVPYGVHADGDALRMNYVTEGEYGTNVGARVYVLDENDASKYKLFDLRGKEIEFTVDVSELPCGLNGAVYLTEMPASNPYNRALDATYGVNYGDAQCPRDIKYLEGKANLGDFGACSNEVDLWEANSRATAFAIHPCAVRGVEACDNDVDCGVDAHRHEGVCDKDGADFNFNRVGVTDFYGRGDGFAVDTTRHVTVVTQFPVDAHNVITEVRQVFKQRGPDGKLKVVQGGSLSEEDAAKQKAKFGEPNHFAQLGGYKTISEAFDRGMVLILSLWDDEYVSMRWLDSVYPVGSDEPGAYRGPCADVDTSIEARRRDVPDSHVVYSGIVVRDLQEYDGGEDDDCAQRLACVRACVDE